MLIHTCALLSDGHSVSLFFSLKLNAKMEFWSRQRLKINLITVVVAEKNWGVEMMEFQNRFLAAATKNIFHNAIEVGNHATE